MPPAVPNRERHALRHQIGPPRTRGAAAASRPLVRAAVRARSLCLLIGDPPRPNLAGRSAPLHYQWAEVVSIIHPPGNRWRCSGCPSRSTVRCSPSRCSASPLPSRLRISLDFTLRGKQRGLCPPGTAEGPSCVLQRQGSHRIATTIYFDFFTNFLYSARHEIRSDIGIEPPVRRT